jgi:hypothetical protein
VRWAEVALDDADFASASTLSAATAWPLDIDLQQSSRKVEDHRLIDLEPRPRLVTVRGAHVAALALSDVDLRACRFFGAHGLQSLDIEASCNWPHTPGYPRYIYRETIAEEHDWRGERWDQLSTQPPAWLERRDGPPKLKCAQIAALYRALRKAREDGKDEAGAGDLYYGEMEMRRKNDWVERPTLTDPWAAERAYRGARRGRSVLHAYWLFSGYGLRSRRAIASLAITLLVGAALLRGFGFHGARPTYGRALLFGVESSISVLRAPQANLSVAGEVIQIALRLLGPLFVGLALLALRSGVKR